MDPVEAIDALLEELRRQKAAGVKRVSISEESINLLKNIPAEAGPKSSAKVIVPTTFPAAPVLKIPAGAKVEQLQWLHKKVEDCAETQKYLDGKKPMFGYGSPDAKVFFIGEAPSLEEVQAQRPFVGPAGDLLNKIISATGLTEKDCYFANLMGWRPKPPTAFGKRPPTPAEVAFNRPYLLAQIEIVKPQIIIAAGAQAFSALTHSTVAITQVRGKWHELDGIPLLPTFHPNYLLHSPSLTNKRLVWEDFMEVIKKLGRPLSDKQKAYFTAS